MNNEDFENLKSLILDYMAKGGGYFTVNDARFHVDFKDMYALSYTKRRYWFDKALKELQLEGLILLVNMVRQKPKGGDVLWVLAN